MRTCLRNCLLLCSLAMVFVVPSLAYTDWLPITPEELKMTDVAQQPGAPAVVLYYDENDDDVRHSQEIYVRIKILTEAGRKYGNIEVPYDKKFLEINSIRGRTIQPDGTISTFEGKPFDRILADGGGANVRVKAFAIPNVQVGSIVEYRYFRDYDEKRLYAPYWTLQGGLFRVKQHFSFVPYMRDVNMKHGAVGRGVSWTYMIPKGVAPVDNGLLNKIELTLKDTPAFIEEPDMPPANMFRYNMHFYYDQHRGDSADFWKDEGKFWNKDVERFIGKHAGLAEAVHSTVAATDTPEQKARKIYAFVQSLQNLNYTPRRTAEEMKALGLKEARGVEDVLRQKMGDEEDLARLYVAMAREAGLNAYVVRVATRQRANYFDEHYLSFSQLDHELAIVKLESREVRLDPGVRYCPYGLLYWKHSDTHGLRQNAAKGAELTVVEGSPYADSWYQRDANLKASTDGQLQGTVQLTFKGQHALIQRLEYWKTDEAGKKKGLEDWLKHSLPANAEVTLTNQPAWESDGDLVATFQVTTQGGTIAGHRYLLPLNILRMNYPQRFSHPERQWPIAFDFAFRWTDHLHVALPEGFKVETLPDPLKAKLTGALYSLQMANKGTELEVLREYVLGGTVFAKSDYPDVKAFYEKVKAGDDLQAVLKGEVKAAGN